MDHPGRWLDAVDACKQAGLTYNARDNYKKDMYPDAPKEIKLLFPQPLLPNTNLNKKSPIIL